MANGDKVYPIVRELADLFRAMFTKGQLPLPQNVASESKLSGPLIQRVPNEEARVVHRFAAPSRVKMFEAGGDCGTIQPVASVKMSPGGSFAGEMRVRQLRICVQPSIARPTICLVQKSKSPPGRHTPKRFCV
jgi:hypothetical protein